MALSLKPKTPVVEATDADEAALQAELEAEQAAADKAARAAKPEPVDPNAKVKPGMYKASRFKIRDPYTNLEFSAYRGTEVAKVTSWIELQVLAGVLVPA